MEHAPDDVMDDLAHLRRNEFEGRRPYHLGGDRDSASGRWEIWMDGRQPAAVERPCRPPQTGAAAS